MHSIVVIVFDDKSKADKGKTTLLQLEADGRVGLYGYAVVAKNPGCCRAGSEPRDAQSFWQVVA
jgi:uncharacterized membrane protein